jgi:hypothetical protein
VRERLAGSRARRHGWLFLTPEVEREVPALLARLDPAGPSRGREQARIGALVVAGDEGAWFGYLRACRRRLDGACAAGADPAAAERLAAVLLEQYLLAPSVRDLDAVDRREERALAALATGLRRAAA